MFDFCFWQAIKDDVLSEKWISMANVGFFVKYHGLTTSTFIRFHQPSDLGWERRQWTYAAASLRRGMKHPAELGTDDPHTGPHEEWLSCINHPPLNDDIKKIIDILSICFSGFFPDFVSPDMVVLSIRSVINTARQRYFHYVSTRRLVSDGEVPAGPTVAMPRRRRAVYGSYATWSNSSQNLMISSGKSSMNGILVGH